MFLKIKQINNMLVQEFMRQYLLCKRLPKKQNQVSDAELQKNQQEHNI